MATVKVHDFPEPELGRVVSYEVYDLATNTGWVSVGIDHDTSSFAVETIRRWWYSMGRERYPEAERLFITADGGRKQWLPRATMGIRASAASR